MISRFNRSSGFVDWIFFQCWWGKSAETVADEVGPAALPGGAEHDLADRFDQAAVAVGDDRADAAQTAFSQLTQELGPER